MPCQLSIHTALDPRNSRRLKATAPEADDLDPSGPTSPHRYIQPRDERKEKAQQLNFMPRKRRLDHPTIRTHWHFKIAISRSGLMTVHYPKPIKL